MLRVDVWSLSCFNETEAWETDGETKNIDPVDTSVSESVLAA